MLLQRFTPQLLVLMVAACTPAAPAAPQGSDNSSPSLAPLADSSTRIVAIGDLHGDLKQTRRVLRLAGLTDEDDAWTGGTTTLVQTGDVFDRGPDSLAIYDLLRSLQSQARAAGGEVHLLLGNHEVMNLTGDLRYVHPGDVAAFGGPAARRDALAVDAPLGGWLASLPVVAKVGDSVFAHGGVRASWARLGIDRINARAHDALRAGERERARAEVLGPDGPLWFRGYLTDPEPIACPELEQALKALGAERMVIGHTTQRSGQIASRCGGRVHGIDIGIGAAYGGNLGVWILSDQGAQAVYPDRTLALPGPDRALEHNPP